VTDPEQVEKTNAQADEQSIAIGSIEIGSDLRGSITIGHTIGYSAEQVSALIKQITTTFQPKKFDGRCPYKGLDVFEEEDAELFFGREKLVEDLVGRVKDSRTVFITGPSGSGKSSLARAGLIHALKQGAVKELHSDGWLYSTMKPGREPINTLARTVAGLVMSTNAEDEIRAKALTDKTIFARWCEIALKDRSDKRIVLFIDQFEEVFTQISREEERVAFLNLLTYAASVENGRVILLFAMRSDFVSNCATYPKLNALLNQQFVQIGAMQVDELVSAIAQPALRVGLRIDPDLIAQIINDMEGEPGSLPLMQFALKDLFDSQQEKGGVIALTLDDYLQRGGIRKSLERHADKTFTEFNAEEQELTRSIFSGLIEIGRGVQDTRRTANFDELVPANTKSNEIESIVRKLADARLITTDEIGGKDTVTISHEKLIDAWPWLKKLVNENRDVIALQNEIAIDAKEWNDHKRDASYLYTGARLVNAREKLKTKKLVLSGIAQEFIQAGRARQRRGQLALIGSILFIIVSLILAVVVFRTQSNTNEQLAQRNAEIASEAQAASTAAVNSANSAATAQANAEKQAFNARLGELAAQTVALREKQPILSLLMGIETFNQQDNLRTRSALIDNVNINPQVRQYLNGHTNTVVSVAFSPDGKTIASGSYDGTIILWDVANGQPIGNLIQASKGFIRSIAFSPDGKTIASGGDDNAVILWDVETRRPIGLPLIGHSNTVYNLAYSPDGKMLATGSFDNTVILWDVETQKIIGEPLTGHTNQVYCVAFSPDGKLLASGGVDNTIILWDVETQQPIGDPLTGHSQRVTSVAFSPDGKMLASGSYDSTIILWDVQSRQALGQPLRRHSNSVRSVTFSPDGKLLASGSYDHTIILWDVETHQPISQPFTGHSDDVKNVAFSPDGSMLASGSDDTTIILWNVQQNLPIGYRIEGDLDMVLSVALSPDGKTIASGSNDSTITLWDLEKRKPIGQPLVGHSDRVYSVAFSPDGKILASGSYDKTIILWDVETRQPIGGPLKGHSGVVTSVAFSPDGKTLASSSVDKTIILWDVQTRQQLGQPLAKHSEAIWGVAFNPDGKSLASSSFDNTIILWNIETHQPIGSPLIGHTDSVYSVAFSPDGKTLASGSFDNTIILWDVETHMPLGQPLKGHTDKIYSLAFSQGSKTLASGSYDDTIILWDMETHQPIGEPLYGHTSTVSSMVFTSDSKSLISGSLDKTLIIWDLDPKSWIQKICQRANRNFTRAEWLQYFDSEEYHATCP